MLKCFNTTITLIKRTCLVGGNINSVPQFWYVCSYLTDGNGLDGVDCCSSKQCTTDACSPFTWVFFFSFFSWKKWLAQVTIEELDIICQIPHHVVVSAHHGWNIDEVPSPWLWYSVVMVTLMAFFFFFFCRRRALLAILGKLWLLLLYNLPITSFDIYVSENSPLLSLILLRNGCKCLWENCRIEQF